MDYFPNVAQRDTSLGEKLDAHIIKELTQAGISIVTHSTRNVSEVPTTISGEIEWGEGKFVRAWRYWAYHGSVSLVLARKIYQHGPPGIRAGMHGDNMSPDNFATPSLRELDEWGLLQIGKPEQYQSVKDYHIDTPEALRYFAECLKRGDIPE